MRTRAGLAVLMAAITLTACGGKDDVPPARQQAQARQDSARATAAALRDSGVAVDTQKIDTGTSAATPAEDN